MQTFVTILASTVAIGALAATSLAIWRKRCTSSKAPVLAPYDAYRNRIRQYTIQPSGSHGFDVWFKEWCDTDDAYFGYFNDEAAAKEAIFQDIKLHAKSLADRAIQETRILFDGAKEWPTKDTVQRWTIDHYNERLRSY